MMRKALATLFGLSLVSAPVFAQTQTGTTDDKAHEMGEQNEKEISLEQVPKAARSTIEREAKGQTIYKVEQAEKNGQTVFEAEFKSKNNKSTEIEVNSDGKVLKREHEKAYGG